METVETDHGVDGATDDGIEIGASIEDIAGDDLDFQDPTGPPPIPGSGIQLSLLAGGEEPNAASMKLRGGSIPVEGEFEKGDSLTLVIEARVAEVHFVDKLDPAGFVVSTERRHIARVTSVRREP